MSKSAQLATQLLIVPLMVILAAGTVVERLHDNDYATAHIYGAWWFFLLLALVGGGIVFAIVRQRMWRQWPRLLLCLSALFVLVGGALTASTGKHGSMHLQPGVATSAYVTDRGDTVSLPFTMTLERFEVQTYPGTHSPMDFVSRLTCDGTDVTISMNNIHRQSGYRFYQEDYDGQGGSVLSVAHDPWGITFTYIGYILMAAGIIGTFVSPRSRFRRMLASGAAVVLLLIAAPAASAAPSARGAAPRVLPREAADRMGQICVLYKGRVCPLQTLAKDFTAKLCGSCRYRGYTPEQVLSGWMFYYADWADEPMIKTKGDDVRQLLGSTGRRVSYNTLMAHRDAFELPKGTPSAMGGGMQSKTMRAVGEKYNLVQMLLRGKFVKMFPVADSSGTVGWYAQDDDLPLSVADDDYLFIRKQQSYCQELVVEGDFGELVRVFDKTLLYQQKRAAGVLPAEAVFRAERLYNRLSAGRWLPMLAVTLGLLFFAVAVARLSVSRNERCRRPLFTLLPTAVVALLTVFLLLIFVLRWIAGGHIPMAGGFDSMNLMAIFIGIISLILVRRHSMSSSIGLLCMGFCLLVAMMSGSNPPVTHLMPVLSSPLLTLHVAVIMLSYALFFFVMLNGVVAVIVPSRAVAMRRTSLLMLYPAVALLAIGIVIGAMWANITWGSYWSWDPKEVWALITLLVYLVPLLRQPYGERRAAAFHIYCILAFLSVLVTYFGVNLILGGIHSYN